MKAKPEHYEHAAVKLLAGSSSKIVIVVDKPGLMEKFTRQEHHHLGRSWGQSADGRQGFTI